VGATNGSVCVVYPGGRGLKDSRGVAGDHS